MTRGRRRWILSLAIGVPALAIAGLAIAFFAFPPAPSGSTIEVETKDIPAAWRDETVDTDRADPAGPTPPPTQAPASTEPIDVSAPASSDAPNPADDERVPDPVRPFTTSGALTILGDDEPFGEEAYELTIDEAGAELISSGRFWFKVVVATVNVRFDQVMRTDAALRPSLYEAEFRAPLGFDRAVTATFADDRVVVEHAKGTVDADVELDRAFVQGTFSTYALVPRLFALREEDGEARFDLFAFGGPPGQGTDGDAVGGPPTVTVTRAGTAILRAGGAEVVVDRYVIRSLLGTSELYARGDEFLAFYAANDEDGTLLAYRTDYFPDGVTFGGPG